MAQTKANTAESDSVCKPFEVDVGNSNFSFFVQPSRKLPNLALTPNALAEEAVKVAEFPQRH